MDRHHASLTWLRNSIDQAKKQKKYENIFTMAELEFFRDYCPHRDLTQCILGYKTMDVSEFFDPDFLATVKNILQEQILFLLMITDAFVNGNYVVATQTKFEEYNWGIPCLDFFSNLSVWGVEPIHELYLEVNGQHISKAIYNGVYHYFADTHVSGVIFRKNLCVKYTLSSPTLDEDELCQGHVSISYKNYIIISEIMSLIYYLPMLINCPSVGKKLYLNEYGAYVIDSDFSAKNIWEYPEMGKTL
jgi:hypothetical protein